MPISQELCPLLLSQQNSGFISGKRICPANLPLCVRSRSAPYLHDAIPVVARGDLKQGKEGHAEVFEGGVTTHTLTRVVCVANWGRRKGRREGTKMSRGDEMRREGVEETEQGDKLSKESAAIVTLVPPCCPDKADQMDAYCLPHRC